MNTKIIKKRKSVKAITPVIGTIMMIGLTIAVGFAAWAWARSAAVNSEVAFNTSVAANANFLKENYMITNINYSASSNGLLSVWFYNLGNTTVYVKQLTVYNSSSATGGSLGPLIYSNSTLSSQSYSACSHCLQLQSGVILQDHFNIVVTLKANGGYLYTFKTVGLYGNTYSIQQAK